MATRPDATRPDATRRSDAGGMLPLAPVDFQILLVLAESDLHGYGVMKAVEEQSAGRVRLEVGSLYRVIKRLLDAGLIEESGGAREPRAAGSRGPTPRRFYGISEFGRDVAEAEAARLADVVDTARARALLSGKRA